MRRLADESFRVVVVEDCCGAAKDSLHRSELATIDTTYCHVVQIEDVVGFLRD